MGFAPACGIVAPTLARIVDRGDGRKPLAPKDLEQVIAHEMRCDRGCGCAPTLCERRHELRRCLAAAQDRRDAARRLPPTAARMQHRELDSACPLRFLREPLEHDALGATVRKRGDQHSKRLAAIIDRDQAGNRARDQRLGKREHQ
jgi:hypothetical protein